jgi:HlyD family secretion protein
MKRLLWGTVATGVAALGVTMLARARTTQAENTATRAEAVRVVRRDIASVVKATGVIKARVGAEVRVGSRISGVVKRLYVQIGDSVRKGQLLAELDDRDLTARRDEADAARARLEVELEYARIDLRRKRDLAKSGGITPIELDVAERAASVTEQQLAGAKASLAFAAAQLEYTKVTAPIDGVVASVSTQEGETVAASFAAPTFLTLLDPTRLEVRAYVDETDIGRVRAGQTARFTVDTYGDHEFDGRVTAVYPTAEIRDNVVNYVTVVRFQPPKDRVLRPEMTTTVRIALATRSGVLAVPIRALRWQDGRAIVLVRRGTAIEQRAVKTGSRDESWAEVVDGLREGEDVLVGEITPNATTETGAER